MREVGRQIKEKKAENLWYDLFCEFCLSLLFSESPLWSGLLCLTPTLLDPEQRNLSPCSEDREGGEVDFRGGDA